MHKQPRRSRLGRVRRAGRPIVRALGAACHAFGGFARGFGEGDEHRRTAADLRRSQDTVQALLDATSETALLIDTAGRIIALNEVACDRLCQLSSRPVEPQKENLIGSRVYGFFPEGLRERRKARNEEAIRSGEPARFEDERDGRWMDNTIYPITDGAGAVVQLAVFSYDITQRKETERAQERALEAERERARRDALTGALNHGAIVEELQALLTSGTTDQPHIVAVVDVDGLKAINDGHGHRIGDAVLVAVADALRTDGAVVGRYGGDEFVAILAGADRTRGDLYVEQVSRALAATLIDEVTRTTIPVRASIGFSVHPGEASEVGALIALADSRMYAAKRQRPFIMPGRAA